MDAKLEERKRPKLNRKQVKNLIGKIIIIIARFHATLLYIVSRADPLPNRRVCCLTLFSPAYQSYHVTHVRISIQLSIDTALEMATFCCSLCSLAIPSDKHRNKRKLHGTSPLAAKVKVILRALSPIPLESLEGLQDPKSVLCYKCEDFC